MYVDKLICMASHDFQWQLYPLTLMLWKYWGRPIQIIYYCDWVEGHLPPGVEARQVPLMRERSEKHWSWQSDFGDGFASILRDLTDPVLLVSMLDYWLVQPAQVDKIDALAQYMETHPNVVRAALGVVPGVEQWSHLVERWAGMDIMTCRAVDNFNAGVMFNVGLFNRETTLQVIRNTCVLDSEIMGWKEMQKRPDLMSVWVRNDILYPYAHATVRTAREEAFIRDVVRKEDRDLIKALLPQHVHSKET